LDSSECVLIVATMDTKANEAMYLEACLEEAGVPVEIMDAGIKSNSPVQVSIGRNEVAEAGGKTLAEVQGMGNEGDALGVMSTGAIKCARELLGQGRIRGVLGLGGSMGTTLGTAVMRDFPVGFPKVMISTMASRDTRPFVGTKDIFMLHSVCDISGLNRITRRILRNGAMAMAGMCKHAREPVPPQMPLVLISTLGTTEACVQKLRERLTAEGKEVVIFHTVGAGGKAMEEMVHEEAVAAVVDLSLHEIADHLFGGDYDAGSVRGTAALKKGTPTVLVPGNIDFLVTGPLKIAQKRFPGRPFHTHNSAITVVRTERQEMATLGRVIADMVNAARGPCRILVPLGGFSAFDHREGPLHDPGAPEFFAEALREGLNATSSLRLLPYHINDPEFADEVGQAIIELLTKVGPG